MANHNITTDIVIIGAGMVGMTMACSLASKGIKVTIIEKYSLDSINKLGADGRVSAISLGSKEILEEYGLWNGLEAGAIKDIHILDNHSPLLLHFDHKKIGNEPVGYMVQNYYLQQYLFSKIRQYENIKIIDGLGVRKVMSHNELTVIELEDESRVNASLLIAADGKNSYVRKLFGIETVNVNYQQTAIICNVKHSKNHENIAVEHFMTSGPFAILPIYGGYHSALVWTERTNDAARFLAMAEDEMLEEIKQRFGSYFGEVSFASKVSSYSLSLTYAHNMVAKRMALIGDAAHGMHPIAGQGYNLGVRDIKQLCDYVTQSYNKGLDIGSDYLLSKYQKSRKADIVSMLSVTDALNRLFASDHFPISFLRRKGLAIVNKIAPAKAFLMKQAMGFK